jgi:hypothetical protein
MATAAGHAAINVRKGQAEFPMSRLEFNTRFRTNFADPAFAGKKALIDELMELAWDGYQKERKSPVTQKAGAGFSDPDYDLSVDWLTTRNSIHDAQAQHDNVASASRVLLVCGADKDVALHQEVRNAARALITQVTARRADQKAPNQGLQDPRPK